MSIHFGPLPDAQAFEQEREIAQLSRENEKLRNELSSLRSKELEFEHGKDKHDKFAEEAEKLKSDAEISDAMTALQIAEERLENETNEQKRQILMNEVQKKKDKLKRASDYAKKYFKMNGECESRMSKASAALNIADDSGHALLKLAMKNKRYEEIVLILETMHFWNVLSLEDINVGDSGAIAIAEALKTKNNLSFTTIFLLNCKIGDAGARALADALKINKNVVFLALDNNPISEDTIKKIKLEDSRISFDKTQKTPWVIQDLIEHVFENFDNYETFKNKVDDTFLNEIEDLTGVAFKLSELPWEKIRLKFEEK